MWEEEDLEESDESSDEDETGGEDESDKEEGPGLLGTYDNKCKATASDVP